MTDNIMSNFRNIPLTEAARAYKECGAEYS